MKQKKIHIAIIDNGISEELLGFHLYKDIIIKNETIFMRKHTKIDYPTHGLICTAIIKQYASNVLMSSLCILEESKVGNVLDLCIALRWCMENKVDIVNISLGSHFFQDRNILKETVNQCRREGMILVCAADNRGVLTYPASFSSVIGVRNDNTGYLRTGEWDVLEESNQLDGIEVVACAEHSISLVSGETFQCGGTNSFAAPLITGVLARKMTKQRFKYVEEAKKWLANNGKQSKKYCNFFNSFDWIEKAVCIQLENCNYKLDKIPLQFNCAMKHIHNKEQYIDTIKKGNLYVDAVFVIYNTEEHKLDFYNLIKICNHIIIVDIKQNSAYYFSADYNKHYLFVSDYQILTYGKTMELSIPVIHIVGAIESVLMISNIIQNDFVKEGYSVLICADYIVAVLCGYLYVKEENLKKEILAKISEIRMADLIILLSEKELKKEYIDSTILINQENDIINAKFVHMDHNIFFSEKKIDEGSHLIYESIFDFLIHKY